MDVFLDKQLQRIVAMFRAAPFVEGYSRHLYQLIVEEDPGFAETDRLAVALRLLRLDTLEDIVDGVQATMTATSM